MVFKSRLDGEDKDSCRPSAYEGGEFVDVVDGERCPWVCAGTEPDRLLGQLERIVGGEGSPRVKADGESRGLLGQFKQQVQHDIGDAVHTA
ncbi:hypothetical protein OG426_30345 [Streptomyces canus]|uniref:hypothetical protein n=1 Tax=Streptomyces canus TaxID=58343 RepID=UPI003868759A|nr:hypothetical protein OG426_30345 [Streptomyces canus]